MSDRKYAEDFYSAVEGIVYSLLDGSEEEIIEELSEEYDVDTKVLENSLEDLGQLIKKTELYDASIGMSWRLSEKYFESKGSESTVINSFEEFKQDSVNPASGLENYHLTQHVHLYSRIIQEEGLETEPITGADIIQKNNDQMQSHLLDTLENIEEELSENSSFDRIVAEEK